MMPRVLWADAEDAELATRVGFTAEEKEQEYYYDPGLVAALEGSGYKELRKRIRRTERRYSPEFREMISDDIPDCHVLLKQWRRLQGRKHSFLLDWGVYACGSGSVWGLGRTRSGRVVHTRRRQVVRFRYGWPNGLRSSMFLCRKVGP